MTSTCNPEHTTLGTTHRKPILGAVLVVLSASTWGCGSDDPAGGTVRSPQRASAQQERVTFGAYGKLGGGMSGYAWVAAGEEAVVETPNPCNEREGCFKDIQGGLCTRGSMPALTCVGGPTSFNCNYSDNWGAMVGLNPGAPNEPWGDGAPQSVAVSFAGGPGNYRLLAHVAGDPVEKNYCIDGYVSGLSVGADQFSSECWSSEGQPLAGFAEVDRIGLMITSAKTPVSFDYCVTSVALNAPVERDQVLIGDNGKLSGPAEGYAWVAGAENTTFATPNPCNEGGCFQNTHGKLCAKGSIPALACTGSGSAEYTCNWPTNWGAMIGVNLTPEGAAWGAAARESVTFTYGGGPGKYWLIAHVAGDPTTRIYCVDGYQSGQAVTAEMFKSECWRDSGDMLPSFAKIDSLGLMICSSEAAVDFDYCIDAIAAR